jgi:ankyrin repeat protein
MMNDRPDTTVSPLLDALYRDDSDTVESLLTSEPELDVFEAAALGRTDRVRQLLDEDPERAHEWSSDGFTALHLAAFFGHAPAARLLLEHGADPALRSRHQFIKVTPLHSAVAREGAADVETAKVLIEGGAPIGAREEGGHTPLHSAASNGSRPMVELLLANGADPLAARDDGKTPRELALEGGHEEVAELLR